jgi:hypothetical protein
MSDPLVGFDWTHILGRYDALCSRFDPHSGHVTALRPLPSNDRLLYYHLIEAARPSVSGVRPLLDIRWYEALLYWKLYSQPYIKNISAWLPRDATSRSRDSEQLRHLLARMPTNIPQELSAIVSLLKTLDSYSLGGMKTVSAFPVRSTFLHILYPKVVPIFDKMVLQSVGIEDEGANHNLGVFCQYLPHAWTLARRHAEKFTRYKETPVRLIDMALWIVRNSAGRRRCPVA